MALVRGGGYNFKKRLNEVIHGLQDSRNTFLEFKPKEWRVSNTTYTGINLIDEKINNSFDILDYIFQASFGI
jgi:hypothetical protein